MNRSRHELVLALLILVLCAVIGACNPVFLSWGNLFDLARNGIVPGLFALGVLLIMIGGGIDISFTAIGVCAMYTVIKTLDALGFEGTAWAPFLGAALIGALLGCMNAALVSYLRLPTLIVTLGTANFLRGFLRACIGTVLITTLPPGLIAFSRLNLWTHTSTGGTRIGLTAACLILAAAAVLCALWLRFTVAGRGVHAMGGNAEAASRAGFNLTALRFMIFGASGALAGTAGMVHAAFMRNANPFDLAGDELTVLAAVVLGGASVTGGRGSVTGTLLGVYLLVIMENSLILLGIPTTWQRVAAGLTIIAATAVSMRRGRRAGGAA